MVQPLTDPARGNRLRPGISPMAHVFGGFTAPLKGSHGPASHDHKTSAKDSKMAASASEWTPTLLINCQTGPQGSRVGEVRRCRKSRSVALLVTLADFCVSHRAVHPRRRYVKAPVRTTCRHVAARIPMWPTVTGFGDDPIVFTRSGDRPGGYGGASRRRLRAVTVRAMSVTGTAISRLAALVEVSTATSAAASAAERAYWAVWVDSDCAVCKPLSASRSEPARCGQGLGRYGAPRSGVHHQSRSDPRHLGVDAIQQRG